MMTKLEARFWSKVDRTEGCWLWTASRFPNGYGQFQFEGRPVGAHRMAHELEVGPIPEGVQVLHTCDTPACVNPEHLFLGTHKENMEDKVAKGRGLCGERHHLARLDAEKVRTIRRSRRTCDDLAREFGVDPSTVERARRGDTWKQVE